MVRHPARLFISSSALSKVKASRKVELEKSYAKTGNRDAGQVLANGGAGMLLCVLNAFWPHEGWVFAFIGVMAAVTADTWATELGSLSRKPPRSVLNGRVLPPGTSGGVSLLGSTAAAGGGALIGLFAWLFERLSGPATHSLALDLVLGIVGGLAGAFADSILGASVQIMYQCPVCGKEVEVMTHCGSPTRRMGGWRFMNNDAVNIVSSFIGGGSPRGRAAAFSMIHRERKTHNAFKAAPLPRLPCRLGKRSSPWTTRSQHLTEAQHTCRPAFGRFLC